MELIYLWVKKYKNIKEQGFNFSPRFECTYDEVTQELTIDEKKDYVNIFSENINITAIVGENGSGKSSVLECMTEIFRIEYNKNRNLIVDDDHTFNFCLAFKIKNKTYKIKSLNNRDSNSFVDDQKIENILDYYIYSNDQSNIANQILLDNTSIAKMLVYDYSNNKEFRLSSFMYLPNQIEIRLCDFEKKFEKLISNNKLYPMNRYEPDSIYLQKMGDNINNQLKYFNSITDEYHQFLILQLLEKFPSTVNYYQSKEDIIKELNTEDLIKEEDFNQYFTSLNTLMVGKTKNINELTKEEKSIYVDKYSDFFEFDFIDAKQRRYSDLSHGEKTLFGQLLHVHYSSRKSKNDNLFFLFDEPEISLHPNWQKSYIKELHTLLNKLQKNYHFIFASHSPFLLSDLPKENVIFLEKDKDGNCKNSTKDINIKPFGANIHTLLSHGFFMKDGLMGEFAKEKINIAINYLNQKTLSENEIEYCENIISIIGEPILGRQLQKMLDSKRLIKIDDINKKIKDMEYELSVLKKHQNKATDDELKDRAKRKYTKKKKDDE